MKQYHEHLKAILEQGTPKYPERGQEFGTLSLFGYQNRYKLSEGFPILTTKKVSFKNIVVELLWFLKGDTNIKYLVDNGVNIWNEDAYLYYQKLCPQLNISPVSIEKFLDKVKNQEKVYSYTYGDCGEQYGSQWREFNKIPTYIVQPKQELPKEYIATTKLGTNGEGSSGDLKSTWEQMIVRCYNKESIGYSVYGAKGVYVSNEWLIFKNFEKDVTQLEGWEEKQKDWNNYQLDKDFFGNGFVYSKETCKWINRVDNCSSHNTIYIFEKEGVIYRTNNIRKLSREHNVEHSNMVRIVKGERNSAAGFKFIGLENLNKGTDQISELINNLKNKPGSRRHILTAWNPNSLNNMALHPCHALFQFNTRKLSFSEQIKLLGRQHVPLTKENIEMLNLEIKNSSLPKYYLDCQLYQRSADMFLGVPYNISSYALLIHIISKICNMIPGDFVHTFGDSHIYDNHKEQVQTLLDRDYNKYKLPTVIVPEYLSDNRSLDEIINDLEPEHFKLEEYESYPEIKADLVTGLKK
jgi:thymidylate synthase